MNQVGVVVLWCFWLGKFMHWTWGRAKRLCLLKIVRNWGTSLAVQWLRLQAPSAGGLGLIPGHGIRSYVPKVRPGAAKKKKSEEFYVPKRQREQPWKLVWGKGHQQKTLKQSQARTLEERNPEAEVGVAVMCVCVCACLHALNVHSHPLHKPHQDIVSKVHLARWCVRRFF